LTFRDIAFTSVKAEGYINNST